MLHIPRALYQSKLVHEPARDELPVAIKNFDPSIARIGHVHSVAYRINRDGGRVVEFSFATSFLSPGCEHLSIRSKLNNSCVALIDNIDRVVRANREITRTIESRFRSFPLG
jgi:hypothetical protein